MPTNCCICKAKLYTAISYLSETVLPFNGQLEKIGVIEYYPAKQLFSVNEYTIPRWKEIFGIKKYFEEKIGKSIYSFLPNIKENTFEF